jgi:GH18 family chitinase
MLTLVASLLLAACAAPRTTPVPTPRGERPVLVGYLAGWGVRGKGTRIDSLPADRLTHVIYAFANIDSAGRAVLGDPCVDAGLCPGAAPSAEPRGNFGALAALKRRHPHLKVLVAIGGWSWSGRFSDVALTDSSRRAFAASALDALVRRWPGVVDGIDIDWEYPVRGGLAGNARRPEDRRNFTLLMAELRRQLDAETARGGRRYWLTAATSAGAGGIANLELDSLARVVDWLNVMTYDYHGGGAIAHFNAPLHAAANDPTPSYNVDSTVAMYLRGGMPAAKVVIGVPFYSRSYGGVAATNDGLFQPAGPAPREWSGAGLDVRNLTREKLEGAGFTLHREPRALAPWAYNRATGVWITFDDAESLARKADFARERGLGGVMIWELGGDDGRMVRLLDERLRAR